MRRSGRGRGRGRRGGGERRGVEAAQARREFNGRQARNGVCCTHLSTLEDSQRSQWTFCGRVSCLPANRCTFSPPSDMQSKQRQSRIMPAKKGNRRQVVSPLYSRVVLLFSHAPCECGQREKDKGKGQGERGRGGYTGQWDNNDNADTGARARSGRAGRKFRTGLPTTPGRWVEWRFAASRRPVCSKMSSRWWWWADQPQMRSDKTFE